MVNKRILPLSSLIYSGMNHLLYIFCHLLTSKILHPSSILYSFRLHCSILFLFSINLCYKINTTHNVTLSGALVISISSKLKLFKTEEYISREKKYETLKQMKKEIFWVWEIILELKSYGKKTLFYSSNASSTVTVGFEK